MIGRELTVDTDGIQVELSIRLGRSFRTVSQLANLTPNDVIALEQSVDEGVEICVGDVVIARGVLAEGGPGDSRLYVRVISAAEKK